MTIRRRVWATVSLALCLFAKSGAGEAATPGGTVIVNSAEATYSDTSGHAYGTFSNAVNVTVASVGSLVVAPKENGCNPGDRFSLGAPLVRTFTIDNTSNITDAYTIQSATTSAGSLASIAFLTAAGPIPVTKGITVSPNVAPGSSIAVQVTVATGGISPGTDVALTLAAQTTAGGTVNGLQSDAGKQCAIAAAGPKFGGPGGANTPVQKLVDGLPFVQTPAGAIVHYSIAFENYGGMPAANATLTDSLPAGVTASLASVKIDGAVPGGGAITSVGQELSIALGTIAPGSAHAVTFDANTPVAASLGTTYVNTANIGASNAAPSASTPAVVFTGTADIVYDGNIGGSAPLAGAVLTLLDQNGVPLALGGNGSPLLGGVAAQNPYTTGSDGTYALPLLPAQLGTPARPAKYTLTIVAPGYANRRIGLVLTPDPTGSVYALDETPLDGQYLAVPGGFALGPGTFHYPALFGFFGNLPLFAQHGIDVTKSADRSVVSAGDRVIFTVHFGPASSEPFSLTTVVDTLPPGLLYAPGTGRLDGAPAEPQQRGNVLIWTLSTLAKPHSIGYATAVAPGVEPGTQATNRVTVSARTPNDPQPQSASADATVSIVSGAFSDRIVITGRAYIDRAGLGRFAPGDFGVAGVRIYLEDGESVVTDQAGRYTFPGARPGMHVLRLDETTLPPRIAPFADRRIDSERSTRRLVHGVFDALTMQDVNFALDVKR